MRPTSSQDNLYQADYQHLDEADKKCTNCVKKRLVKQSARRVDGESTVHFGTVASGNQVIKDGTKRAEIAAFTHGILANETEAAAHMDIFSCGTIPGACDYADSHRNDCWRRHAAAVATDVLEIIRISEAADQLRRWYSHHSFRT